MKHPAPWLDILGWAGPAGTTPPPLRFRDDLAWIRAGNLMLGHEPDGELVLASSLHGAPAQFVVVVDNPKSDVVVAFEVHVSDALALECFEVDVVRRPGSRRVSIDRLREITVQTHIDEAFRQLAGLRVAAVDEKGYAVVGYTALDDTATWESEAARSFQRRARIRSQGAKVARARAAAQIYEEHIPLGSPTKAVQDALGVSHSTAVRLINDAIEWGVASPAVAEHRGRQRERKSERRNDG